MSNTIVVDPTRYEKMTFTKTICFEAGDITIKFIPVDNFPGYSYKVVALRDGQQVGKGWAREGTHPTHKNAEFFYNSLVNGVYKS